MLTDYCLKKNGSTRSYPFGEGALVFKVASKMYALVAESARPLTINLKCDPFIAENLRQQYASITPGYHMNKKHWNTVILDGSIEEEELCSMIDHSYDLVFHSLKKAEKAELGG
jgi:predicted DNA-binding protein (MmcQ/YjbR family)